MSGKKSRRKGARGEIELLHVLEDLSKHTGRRRYEQHAVGGHDLEFEEPPFDMFKIECKRVQDPPTDSLLKSWWGKLAPHCEITGFNTYKVPLLAYRSDFREWRFMLPLSVVLLDDGPQLLEFEWTCTLTSSSLKLWLRMTEGAREEWAGTWLGCDRQLDLGL